MSDGMIISLIVWIIGVLFFSVAIALHYKRQPNDRLPWWGTVLVIVFWFVVLPLVLLLLIIMWIDFKYFPDSDD